MGNIRCVLVDCKLQHNTLDVGRQGCAINVPPAHNTMGMPRNSTKLSCMPGARGGLALRIGQLVLAFIAFMILVKFPGYHSITCFRYFVTALIFQCVWSAVLAGVDVYAMVTDTCLHYCCLVTVFAIGDWVTSIFTFSAACALAGITTLIDDDLNQCSPNHCSKYEGAAAMAFLCWMLLSVSFYHSFTLQARR